MTGKVLWRKIRAPFEYVPLRLAVGLLGFLPYSSLRFWAGCIARLVELSPRRRNLVGVNLRIAFPEWTDAQVAKVAAQVWNNVMLTALEVLWFTRHPDSLRQAVSLDTALGKRFFDMAAHGPLIFLTPHLGNWELAAQGFAAAGGRLAAVARPARNPWLAALLDRTRCRHGMEMVASRGAARGAMRALRDGKTLGMLIDQNVRPRRGGVFVDFFGLPVPTSRAPASLARRLDARVVCAALIRGEDGFHFETVELERPPSTYSDDIELTADLLRLNEELIRRHPEQYAWSYERWRYVPADVAPDLRTRYPPYAKL